MVIIVEGVEYTVNVVRVDELLEIGDEMAEKALAAFIACCGAFSSILTAERIQEIQKQEAPEPWAETFRNLKPNVSINVLWEVISRLSEEEYTALLLHEVHHIKSGFLERKEGLTKVNGIEVMVSLQAELDADAYAAERVGKSAVSSMLKKCIETTAKSRALAENRQLEDVLQEMLCLEYTQARLAALS